MTLLPSATFMELWSCLWPPKWDSSAKVVTRWQQWGNVSHVHHQQDTFQKLQRKFVETAASAAVAYTTAVTFRVQEEVSNSLWKSVPNIKNTESFSFILSTILTDTLKNDTTLQDPTFTLYSTYCLQHWHSLCSIISAAFHLILWFS